MLHFTPPGYVQCDLCACIQPLSAVITYLDGHVCAVHKPQIEAQLAHGQQPYNYGATIRQQKKDE